MKKYNLEGVVLRAVNFKDSDKIFTIFTRELGKVSVLAKGIRKISSRRSGAMDTLNHVLIGVVESSTGYKVLTETKSISSFKDLKNSLENSIRGFYVAELVYRFLENDHPNEQVFDLFLDSLQKLNLHLNNETSRVNAFEISLMSALGYEMSLSKCVESNIQFDRDWQSFKFNFSLGGLVSNPNSQGLPLMPETAELLFSLQTKKQIPTRLLNNYEAVIEADKVVKTFVKEVLEENIKSLKI